MKKVRYKNILFCFIFAAVFLVAAVVTIDGTMALTDSVIDLQTLAGNVIISAWEWPQIVPTSVNVEEFPQYGRWFVGRDGETRFYDKLILKINLLAQDRVSCGPLFFYRDSLAKRGNFLLRKF